MREVDRRGIVVLVAVLAVISALTAAVLFARSSPGVTVQDYCSGDLANVTIVYSSGSQDYLATSYGDVPGACSSFTAPAGSSSSFGLVLHNSDTNRSHAIVALGIAA